jgi:hypothetical protein
MNKKNILLAVLIILLTGCSVNYNLVFKDDLIEETITITPENTQEKQNAQQFENRDYYAIIDANNQKKYKKTIESDGNYIFNYKYDFSNFKNSRFTSCYDAYTLTNDSGIITLSTSKKFKCTTYDYNEVENITINISTEYKVVENNADEIDGNVYKWHINKNNKDNKPIKFSYNKNKKRKITLKEFLEQNKISIMIIASALSLFIIITISIYIKHKRVNKI